MPKGVKTCSGGLTGYNNSSVVYWRCPNCDYDMCITCMQHDLIYMRLLE
jgi:hypothetical protein